MGQFYVLNLNIYGIIFNPKAPQFNVDCHHEVGKRIWNQNQEITNDFLRAKSYLALLEIRQVEKLIKSSICDFQITIENCRSEEREENPQQFPSWKVQIRGDFFYLFLKGQSHSG